MQTQEHSPQCVLKSFQEVSARRMLPKPDITGQRVGELTSACKVMNLEKDTRKCPYFRLTFIHIHRHQLSDTEWEGYAV